MFSGRWEESRVLQKEAWILFSKILLQKLRIGYSRCHWVLNSTQAWVSEYPTSISLTPDLQARIPGFSYILRCRLLHLALLFKCTHDACYKYHLLWCKIKVLWTVASHMFSTRNLFQMNLWSQFGFLSKLVCSCQILHSIHHSFLSHLYFYVI